MGKKVEIVTKRRDSKIGSAYVAIMTFANSIGFNEYTLIANHNEGSVVFISDDNETVVRLRSDSNFFEQDLDELFEMIKVESLKLI